nr:5E5 antigen-like [Meriones unguiculatus]
MRLLRKASHNCVQKAAVGAGGRHQRESVGPLWEARVGSWPSQWPPRAGVGARAHWGSRSCRREVGGGGELDCRGAPAAAAASAAAKRPCCVVCGAGGGGGGSKAERGDGRDTTHGTRWPERQQQPELSGGLSRPAGRLLRWEQSRDVPEGSGRAGRPRPRQGGRARVREPAAEAPAEAGPATPGAALRQRRGWWRARSGGGPRRGREAAAGAPSARRGQERADGVGGRSSTRNVNPRWIEGAVPQTLLKHLHPVILKSLKWTLPLRNQDGSPLWGIEENGLMEENAVILHNQHRVVLIWIPGNE